MHGRATQAELVISASSISVIDDGEEFNTTALRLASEMRGGAGSLRRLSERFRGSVVFSYAREDGKNASTFVLVRSTADLARLSPCTVQITAAEMYAGVSAVRSVAGCDHTFVILPRYFALSDVFKLPNLLADAFPGSRYVLVGAQLSEGVVELIQEQLPGVEVLVLA